MGTTLDRLLRSAQVLYPGLEWIISYQEKNKNKNLVLMGMARLPVFSPVSWTMDRQLRYSILQFFSLAESVRALEHIRAQDLRNM